MIDGERHGEGGSSQAERFWEGHYQAHERLWSGGANPVLVDVAGSLLPGTALDLGCGEGGDAIWLAGRGWRVTAVDMSATALSRASTHPAVPFIGHIEAARVVEGKPLGRGEAGGAATTGVECS